MLATALLAAALLAPGVADAPPAECDGTRLMVVVPSATARDIPSDVFGDPVSVHLGEEILCAEEFVPFSEAVPEAGVWRLATGGHLRTSDVVELPLDWPATIDYETRMWVAPKGTGGGFFGGLGDGSLDQIYPVPASSTAVWPLRDLAPDEELQVDLDAQIPGMAGVVETMWAPAVGADGVAGWVTLPALSDRELAGGATEAPTPAPTADATEAPVAAPPVEADEPGLIDRATDWIGERWEDAKDAVAGDADPAETGPFARFGALPALIASLGAAVLALVLAGLARRRTLTPLVALLRPIAAPAAMVAATAAAVLAPVHAFGWAVWAVLAVTAIVGVSGFQWGSRLRSRDGRLVDLTNAGARAAVARSPRTHLLVAVLAGVAALTLAVLAAQPLAWASGLLLAAAAGAGWALTVPGGAVEETVPETVHVDAEGAANAAPDDTVHVGGMQTEEVHHG